MVMVFLHHIAAVHGAGAGFIGAGHGIGRRFRRLPHRAGDLFHRSGGLMQISGGFFGAFLQGFAFAGNAPAYGTDTVNLCGNIPQPVN